MEKTSSSSWVHFIKVLLVGTTLCLSIFSTPSEGVLKQSKQSKRSTIRQTIVNLKQSQRRWIQIDLSQQRLIAWEGKKPVYKVIVSTGKKSTPTRTGVFRIQTKLRKTRMRVEATTSPMCHIRCTIREAMLFMEPIGIEDLVDQLATAA